jgi:hypothetical protein
MSNSPRAAKNRRSNCRGLAAFAAAVTLAALSLFTPLTPEARAQSLGGSPDLVVSQLYTRGGEPGATYQKDFIELFNRGPQPVNMNNYSLHMSTTTGPIPTGITISFASSGALVVQPGRYLLIGLKGEGTAGQPLPTPDFDLSILPAPVPISLNSTTGLVVLVRPDGSFQGCPNLQSTGVADFVGYGATSVCYEGPGGPAPAPALPTESAMRLFGGCTDNNINAFDFNLGPVNPRNSASPAGLCPITNGVSIFNFGVPEFHTFESAGRAEIVVTRTGDLTTPASVEYTITGGTADQRGDYTMAGGRLRFAAGESSKSFDVLITNDATKELNETIEMMLWKPEGAGAVTGVRDRASLVIHDNDLLQATSNPVDDSTFFVRQHYHDFLNREPDAAGLAFWVGGIESCGSDAACREVKRIDTSAAFFLSIEFQRTGFLVYSLYRAALPERDYRVRSLPRYLEFVRDTQEVGRGVVVGEPGWELRLEQNVGLFLQDFMSRPEFALTYPESLTPVEYVDKLNQQAGNVLTPEELLGLAAGLAAGAETRASVLRKVAENAEFARRETSRAFVLMQYFGYLRRAPNEAPDTDFAGLDFWLSKLDSFGGDYRRAEMVRAFLSSTEYRARFLTPAP